MGTKNPAEAKRKRETTRLPRVGRVSTTGEYLVQQTDLRLLFLRYFILVSAELFVPIKSGLHLLTLVFTIFRCTHGCTDATKRPRHQRQRGNTIGTPPRSSAWERVQARVSRSPGMEGEEQVRVSLFRSRRLSLATRARVDDSIWWRSIHGPPTRPRRSGKPRSRFKTSQAALNSHEPGRTTMGDTRDIQSRCLDKLIPGTNPYYPLSPERHPESHPRNRHETSSLEARTSTVGLKSFPKTEGPQFSGYLLKCDP